MTNGRLRMGAARKTLARYEELLRAAVRDLATGPTHSLLHLQPDSHLGQLHPP